MVTGEDASEKEKKAEEYLKKLKEKLDYYRQNVINSSDAIIVQDFNGKVMAWNNGAQRIYGFLEKEMLGKNITKIIAPEYQAEARKNISSIKQGKPTFRVKQIRRTKDNKKIFVNITYSPIFEKGEIIEIGTTEEDVTEIKKSLEELKVKEIQFRELFNNMEECVAIYELKNNGKEVIIKDFNKSAEKLEGVKKEDIIGKKVDEVFKGVKEFGLYEIFKRVWKTGESISHPISFYTDKHRQGWRENFIFKLPSGNIVAIYSDITDRKKIEEEILKKNNLLKTIGQINKAIFKIKNRDKLMLKICEIIKNYAYKMVWIGLCEEKTKRVIPIAQAGFDEGYLKSIKIKYDTSKYGIGPTGTAIRTKKPNVMRNISTDQRYAPWKKQAIEHGFHSSIALPIFHKEKVIGAMSVYSEKEDSFNKEEINLLTELTGDISIALEKFEVEEKKKIVEEEIKKSEEKFRSIFEYSLIGVSIVSLEGKWLQVNPALCNMTGYSREELLSRGYMQLTFPEDIERTKEFSKNLIFGKKKYGYLEKRYIRKDKKVIWVSLSVVLISDKNNKPQYFIVHTEDITERKEVQEKKYKSIFESMKQGLYVTKNGRFISVNKAMSEIFGYSEQELLNMHAWELAKPEIRKIVKEKFFSKIKNGDYNPEIVECIKKDGTPLIAEISINKPLKEETSGLVTDITKTREAKETEEKYKMLYESSADAIMTLEPPTWKFTSGNPATIKMFRAENEKNFVIRAPWEYSPRYQPDGKPSSEKAREMIMKAMKDGTNFFEWTHKRLDGEDFPATVLLSRIKMKDKTYLQATVRDLTEQKKMEEKAKESDILKSEFISAISHELRTPITPIKSQIQRMISLELNKDEQKNSLEIVLRNTIRMDRLIQDLLEINRLRAGKLNIFKKKENINEIIRDTIDDLTSFAKEKNTEIIFNRGEIPLINIDRDRILEVTINILDNAIKYGRGKVSIETKKEDGNIWIIVKDNGIGISKEESEKIFYPFYRGKKTEIRKYEGTGLGLAISKGIIEAHGGKIEFKSELGKETTFFIKLPIK